MGGAISCNNNGDYIDGLCYNKCPEGMEHVPGMPYNCKRPGAAPYGRGVGTIPGCAKGQVKSGALCYEDPGPGWRVIAGVAWQDCPAGYKDIGAFCVPGLSFGGGPWYLSFYMLIAAVAMIIIPIGYFRVRSMLSIASSVTGSGRRTKKLLNIKW